jgi:nucleoside-diphosphate-sugar epimerase
MARVLVISGTLFIGRALVDRLLARGDDVVIIHRGRVTRLAPSRGRIGCWPGRRTERGSVCIPH